MIDFKRLRDIREDNDLSQDKMAKILNVNRSTYSLWELGINIIPLNSLCDFSDYFGYSIDYVLGLTNDKNSDNIKLGLDLVVLGKNLKNLRIKNKLSQKDMAIILNVTQPCIAKYEKGSILISVSNLYKISKSFNIPMDVLSGKVESKELIEV